MPIINQVLVEVLQVAERHLQPRNLGGTQTTADPTSTMSSPSATSASPPAATTTSSGGGGGPTSSPLLFFVALGFGVVFTNLWIIVGVKYCFRYNARNRALRNGEDVDPINLENMPTRPHRRRREKKLMTMDEVNERFPLTKYKSWVASRAREGLPTSGGVTVTAPPSRAVSVRETEGVIPSSPVDTKHSVNTRPPTATSEREIEEVTASPEIHTDDKKKSIDLSTVEKESAITPVVEEQNNLEEVPTTTSTVDKLQTTATELEEEDDDDDHILTAVPPELLTNPGDSCAICIDTLEEDDDIRGLTCGHAFHAGCLDPWLTSRRACCPLCKADYYTPKPRPEGEAVDTERSGRRRDARMNMPQQPRSTWNGLRVGGRFGTYHTYNRNPSTNDQRRAARRARRAAPPGDAAGAVTPATPVTPAQANSNAAEPSRWRPRNPFSGIAMPAMHFPGRNRQPTEQNGAPAVTATADPSPSQLEAGVVR
ncbi:E3 ubiquitin-protein ligase [Lachnellula subtilissima]|uniref:E3 ubiquitin-protein ligase n=1 Tax=Lachnellula subtilissima TaxID=602034 RepID=A0A8H8U5R4_9HELO|nr:E3 ubiquitin-protein ligase [Lachnellula subtilissima]